MEPYLGSGFTTSQTRNGVVFGFISFDLSTLDLTGKGISEATLVTPSYYAWGADYFSVGLVEASDYIHDLLNRGPFTYPEEITTPWGGPLGNYPVPLTGSGPLAFLLPAQSLASRAGKELSIIALPDAGGPDGGYVLFDGVQLVIRTAPEPGTLWLALFGLLPLAALHRRAGVVAGR
jgi:hypothetical protein